MKTFHQFIAETKKHDKSHYHVVTVSHNPDQVSRGDISAHARKDSSGSGYDFTTGRGDIDFDYDKEKDARAASKRIRKGIRKGLTVKYYKYPKD